MMGEYYSAPLLSIEYANHTSSYGTPQDSTNSEHLPPFYPESSFLMLNHEGLNASYGPHFYPSYTYPLPSLCSYPPEGTLSYNGEGQVYSGYNVNSYAYLPTSSLPLSYVAPINDHPLLPCTPSPVSSPSSPPDPQQYCSYGAGPLSASFNTSSDFAPYSLMPQPLVPEGTTESVDPECYPRNGMSH